MRIRRVASALVLLGLLFAAPAAEAQAFDHNPMIFVHGFVGSGAQFESQKMRFMSQGYPDEYVTVFEYDSTTATQRRDHLFPQIDQQIADLKQRTGKAQVDMLGHSLGTSVMHDYLNSSAERASNVAHYVNIDGRTASSPPGGVPTLAVWAGRGTPGRSIEGAQNVTIPNQTHVQTATSAESFAEYYKFLTGSPPSTKEIVRQAGPITVAGRAVFFPENNGIPGATVEVWEIDPATGQRVTADPLESVLIGPSGDFGPITVEPGKHYEFALLRPGSAPQHTYYEPFVRSDHLMRLLDSDALEAGVEKGPNHTAGVIIRYKELWGDQGSENDILAINGTNVCNAATCPIAHQVNGMFFMDEGSDGQTDLSAPNPVFFALPFISGVDIFVPAAIPPTGTVSFQITSRGVGPVRTLNVPNFASLTDAVVVQLNDFERTVACQGRAPTIVGTAASDNLTGTSGDDVIIGFGGNDTISGGGGNDRICGGAGRDTLSGGDGNDLLSGQSGPDSLAGDGGHDRAMYTESTSGVTVDIDGEADDGSSSDGPAGARDNVRTDVESLTGSRYDDTLVGSAGYNRLTGGLGADSLLGLEGNDVLFANDGTADSAINCDGGTQDSAHVDAGTDPSPIDCEVVSP